MIIEQRRQGLVHRQRGARAWWRIQEVISG